MLSDVVGDPLGTIASGPTVPQRSEAKKALQLLGKYGVSQDCSAYRYLTSQPQVQGTIRDGHVFNTIVGSNKMATTSAKEAAIGLGYASYVWTVQLRGEASFLGQLYALLSHYMLLRRNYQPELDAYQDLLYESWRKLSHEYPELESDVSNLMRTIEMVKGGPFCLIGSGEPTVRVTGEGKGGRNQELALAYAVKLHELRESCASCYGGDNCVFASVGTDGQDGPCDAAGAIVDPQVCTTALEQGLAPTDRLQDNDSYTFFSLLNSGQNLVRTGLTGTNVMDIHVLLIK